MSDTCNIYNTEIAACVNLEVYRGDNANFSIDFWTDDKLTVAYDLDQFVGTLRMAIKENVNEERAIAVLTETQGGLTITSPINLAIVSTGTQNNLPDVPYYYDVEGVSSISGDRITFLKGTLRITEDVTR